MLEVIKYPIDNCNIPTSVPYSNKMVLFTRKISKNVWIEENIQKKEEHLEMSGCQTFPGRI